MCQTMTSVHLNTPQINVAALCATFKQYKILIYILIMNDCNKREC